MLQEDDRNAFGVLAGRPLLAPGDSHFPLSITCLVPKEDVLLPPRPRGHRYPTEHTLAELNTSKILEKELLTNALDNGLLEDPPRPRLRPAELDPLLSSAGSRSRGSPSTRKRKGGGAPHSGQPTRVKRLAPTPPRPKPALEANLAVPRQRQAIVDNALDPADAPSVTSRATASSSTSGTAPSRRRRQSDIFD